MEILALDDDNSYNISGLGQQHRMIVNHIFFSTTISYFE